MKKEPGSRFLCWRPAAAPTPRRRRTGPHAEGRLTAAERRGSVAEVTEPSDGGRAGARPRVGPGRQPCTSLRSKGLSWGLEEGGCRVVQPRASRPGRCRKGQPVRVGGWHCQPLPGRRTPWPVQQRAVVHSRGRVPRAALERTPDMASSIHRQGGQNLPQEGEGCLGDPSWGWGGS